MELVQTSKNKMQGLLPTWVEEFSDELYSWAVYKTSNKLIAEDLVQDTFLAAIKSFDTFQEDSSPKTWLFSILNYKIIDFYRKKKNDALSNGSAVESRGRFINYFDSEESWKKEHKPQDWEIEENQLLDDQDFRLTLQSCMQKLPSKWLSVMELKYIEGKEGKNICQEVNMSPANYWQILHRAKLQLRGCLENNWFKNL